MEEDLQKQIEARMAELPEDIHAAIAASDFEEKVRTIGATQNLHLDQVGILGDITMMVMLGFTPHEALAASIEKELRVTDVQAQALSTQISTQIFGSIRESIKQFQANKSTPAANTEPSAPATPSKLLEMHPAEMMLSEKTVTAASSVTLPGQTQPQSPAATPPGAALAKPEPPAPKPYTADPYREPVEP